MEYDKDNQNVIEEEPEKQLKDETKDLLKINTLEGIKNVIDKNDVGEFKLLVEERRNYVKGTRKTLDEFVLFGWLLLDEYGETAIVAKSTVDVKSEEEVTTQLNSCRLSSFTTLVERLEDTINNNNKMLLITPMEFTNYAIPNKGDKCSKCGKTIQIIDLIDEPVIFFKNSFYHGSCWEEYEKKKDEIQKQEEIQNRGVKDFLKRVLKIFKKR